MANANSKPKLNKKEGFDLVGLPLSREKLFSRILATIEDGVSVQDRKLRVVYANEAHKKKYGENIEGKFCYNIYGCRRDACPDCPVIETFKTGEPARTTRYSVDEDGQPKALEIIATPIRDTKGIVIAGVEVTRSVTEQFKAQQKIIDKNEKLERLMKLSKDIASGLELDKTLQKVVKNACKALDMEGGLIALLDESGTSMTFPYIQGAPVDLSELSLPVEPSLFGDVIKKNETLVLQKNDSIQDKMKILEKEGIEMAVVTPLVSGDKSVGVLTLFSRNPDKKLPQEDLRTLEAIADQSVMAIEKARLFEETSERLRVRRELTKTAISITSGLEFDNVMAEVARHAADIVKADAAMVAIQDEERELITFPYVCNLPDSLKSMTSSPGQGLAAEVIEKGESRIINDYYSYPDKRPEFIVAGIGAVASVPLQVGDKSVGAISVMDKGSGQQFSTDDLEILSIISRQAAVAVENARLFEELNRLMQQLEGRVRERTEALVRMYQESERKGLELKEANVKLQEVDRLKSEFLANMSHELRTPLNSIIGFSKLILDGLEGELTDDQKKDVEIIHKNGQELLRLIDDLLNLAKIEAGRLSVAKREEDPSELVVDVVVTLRSLAEREGLEIVHEPFKGLKPVIMDRAKTRQVLMTLVSNAIKFMEEGKITVAIKQGPEETVFSVSDMGPGFKPDQLESIFDRFHLIDTDLKTMEGIGLSLAFSKRIIELQGGSMWVESEFGKGSTFLFALPTA